MRAFAFVKELASRLGRGRSVGIAAEMAFWLFLSLLPLAAAAGLVVAKLALSHGTVDTTFLSSFPAATRELIATELGRMAAWEGGEVGVGAALMFFWLASSGVASIFDGVEQETEAKARSWIKKRLLAIGTCIALSIGFAALAILGVGLSWITERLGAGAFSEAGFLDSRDFALVRFGIGVVVSLLLIGGLYWVALPPDKRKAMPILPGAAVALALQLAIGFAYGVYLDTVGDGGAYQAGLASIGVTMIALYLCCLSLLVGIEFNQMIGERRGAVATRARDAEPKERKGRVSWMTPGVQRP